MIGRKVRIQYDGYADLIEGVIIDRIIPAPKEGQVYVIQKDNTQIEVIDLYRIYKLEFIENEVADDLKMRPLEEVLREDVPQSNYKVDEKLLSKIMGEIQQRDLAINGQFYAVPVGLAKEIVKKYIEIKFRI